MPQTDALAALRDGRRYTRRDEQPRKLKLDSGLSLEFPGPRLLATTLVLPWLRERYDVYRLGGAILTRPSGTLDEPTGLNRRTAAEDLRAVIAALPSRTDAGRPYRDLRLFVAHGTPDSVAAYLGEALAAVRLLAAEWRPPRPIVDRAPGLSPVERMAAKRERDRTAEVASARWWLELTLDDPDEDLATGARVTAAVLYELAADTLADMIDDAELLDDDDPASVPRVPGPRVFYSVTDEVLGARRRGTNGAQTYTIPAAFNIARTRNLIRRGQYVRALLLQRDHHYTVGR